MPFDATPITNPVIEALRAGRARVERGWCQRMGSHGNRVCAAVALHGRAQAAIDEAIEHLGRALGIVPRLWLHGMAF